MLLLPYFRVEPFFLKKKKAVVAAGEPHRLAAELVLCQLALTDEVVIVRCCCEARRPARCVNGARFSIA